MEQVNKYQRKLDELKQKRLQKNYWQPKPGKNYIRLLPNWNLEPGGDFWRETGYHKNLGNSKDKSAVCLKREGHNSCPVCSMVNELWSTKDPQDIALAKEIKAYSRVYFNIVDLSDVAKGVQIWSAGTDVLEQILTFCANAKYGDLSDPKDGRNLELNFTEGKNSKSGFNSYSVQPNPDKTPISEPSWLENLVDLDTQVKPLSFEQLEALLLGKAIPADPETEPVETKPVTKPAETKPVEVKSETKVETSCPSCFEKGKFDSEDSDCIVCSWKEGCAEKKAAKKAATPPPTPPVEKKEPPKEAQMQASSGSASSGSQIESLLAKIRSERNKSK